MLKVYRDRLLKLAAFLDKLPRKKFDFSVFYEVNCQTKACALGYCPTVFPKDWMVGKKPYEIIEDAQGGKLKEYGVCLKSMQLKVPGREASFLSAREFFGLINSEVEALFLGDCAYMETQYLKEFGDDATPKQIAGNIRRFIAHKDKEKKS